MVGRPDVLVEVGSPIDQGLAADGPPAALGLEPGPTRHLFEGEGLGFGLVRGRVSRGRGRVDRYRVRWRTRGWGRAVVVDRDGERGVTESQHPVHRGPRLDRGELVRLRRRGSGVTRLFGGRQPLQPRPQPAAGPGHLGVRAGEVGQPPDQEPGRRGDVWVLVRALTEIVGDCGLIHPGGPPERRFCHVRQCTGEHDRVGAARFAKAGLNAGCHGGD